MAPLLVSRYGTVGLVAANCVAMCARALYSVYFAVTYFAKVQKSSVWLVAKTLVRGMFPPPTVLLAYGVAFASTRASLQRLQDYELQSESGLSKDWLWHAGQHVTVGILSVLFVAAISIPFERDFRRSLLSMFREKQE
jgi:Rft protein